MRPEQNAKLNMQAMGVGMGGSNVRETHNGGDGRV
jgi:hypothetical protein